MNLNLHFGPIFEIGPRLEFILKEFIIMPLADQIDERFDRLDLAIEALKAQVTAVVQSESAEVAAAILQLKAEVGDSVPADRQASLFARFDSVIDRIQSSDVTTKIGDIFTPEAPPTEPPTEPVVNPDEPPPAPEMPGDVTPPTEGV